MAQPGTAVVLTPSDKEALSRLADKPTSQARYADRARIVLRIADGETNRQVAERLGCREATVSKWRNRFASEGIGGLLDDFRPGRPPKYDERDVLRRVEEKLDDEPPPGFGRWNGRLLAEALGDVPADIVWRVMRQHGIQLARRRSWCLSTDPEFARKACDVIGMYLDPPDNAVVLSVDEKPCIQALERAQGWLKMPDGKALTGATHEYKRHGTTTLFAALDVATGRAFGECKSRKRREEFVAFLREIEKAYPDREIHIVMDNISTHKITDPEWWKKHPRLHFHFTPTHASWMNQVEVWFSILSTQSLAGSSHTSVGQLVTHIEKFIAAYNEQCSPFKWTKITVKPKGLEKTYGNLSK